MSKLSQFIWLVRYGRWEWGLANKHVWPNKLRLGIGMDYCDGPLFHLHIADFYLCASAKDYP